jgi:hypothetical protein
MLVVAMDGPAFWAAVHQPEVRFGADYHFPRITGGGAQ